MTAYFQDTLNALQVNPFYVLAVAVCSYLIYDVLKPNTDIGLLPTPADNEWFFGHERLVAANQPGIMFKRWASKLGFTYRIKAALGARDVLVLSDPAGINHILQRKIYDYHHSDVVRPRIARLLGEGLGWVEGESEHKRMRQLIAPSLSHENMRHMSHEVTTGAAEVVEALLQHVQSHDSNTQVNLFEWAAKLTLTVIGRVAFLHDFEGGTNDDAQRIINARRKGVSSTMEYAGFVILMLLRRFPILNKLSTSIPALQAQGLAREAIQSGVAHEMVRRNQQLVAGSNLKSHSDLLSRLLIAYSAGSISTTELYAQISTFIITGNDTSAQTLAFLIWELARHPDIQEKLREELKAFPGEPTYDDFQTKLPYLDAVLKETLRLYPGLPYMERVTTKADVIPLRDPVKLASGRVLSELSVSPGQVVLIPIMAIQRMDSVYHDGDEFCPERWLEGNKQEKGGMYSGWANMLVFSDGPRNCVGLRLGLFQMKVSTRYLLQHFRFTDTGDDISFKISSSLQACIADKRELGPCLPVGVEML